MKLCEITWEYLLSCSVTNKKTGCIEWQKNPKGCYGQVCGDGEKDGAHRVSYRLNKGEIPKGLCVLHHCDNPSCVNPDHLFLGTHKDNMDDKVRKNRHNSPRGAAVWSSILSEKDVLHIRKTYVGRYGEVDELAKKYSVAFSTMSEVINGHTWKYLL